MLVKPVIDTTPADWHPLLEVNLCGYYYGCRAAARRIDSADRGRIINIASAADVLPSAGTSAYVAAKGAVGGLTKVSTLQVAGRGITVNAVSPRCHRSPFEVVKGDQVRWVPAVDVTVVLLVSLSMV